MKRFIVGGKGKDLVEVSMRSCFQAVADVAVFILGLAPSTANDSEQVTIKL